MHRLVAAAFLGPPPDDSTWQVNHVDGNGRNNHVGNLRYVTPAENVRQSYITSPDRAAGHKAKAVHWRKEGETVWNTCSSQTEAASLLGVSRASVSRCCRGVIRWTAANGARYEFKSAESKELPCQGDEVWKAARWPGQALDIPRVAVSSHGRVFFDSSKRSRVTYGSCTRAGYYSVQCQGKALLVHRLVAATFLGQPELPNMQVNHKDRDRGNNHVDNLEYVTPSQNVLHALRDERNVPQRRAGRAVLAKLVDGSTGWTRYKSLKAAAEYTGMATATISKACRGEGIRSGLWEFKFADENLEGEEWRPVVLEGARAPRAKTPHA